MGRDRRHLRGNPWLQLQACLAVWLLGAGGTAAEDRVRFQLDGREVSLAGRVEVTAQDGGLLFRTRDDVLWAVQPDQILSRAVDDTPFELLPRDQLTQRLLAELPFGFRVHDTAHYIVLYNTSKAYAEWCGSLYERLHRGFYNYWRKRGLRLTEPEQPLVALVFEDKRSYGRYTRPELGEAAESIVGYYSLKSNRMHTHDLTGVGEVRRAGPRPKTAALVNEVLSQPHAAPLVATLIHEAAHQLAYNTGLQTRYADNPLWISEGLAMFFETPDLGHSKGWRSVGAVNPARLREFRARLPSRRPDALEDLLTHDERLRDVASAAGGYADAWALCYFLLNRHAGPFVAYLQELANRPLLVYDTPAERLQRFAKHFGDDLAALDAEFLRFMRGVR